MNELFMVIWCVFSEMKREEQEKYKENIFQNGKKDCNSLSYFSFLEKGRDDFIYSGR